MSNPINGVASFCYLSFDLWIYLKFITKLEPLSCLKQIILFCHFVSFPPQILRLVIQGALFYANILHPQ